MQPRLPRTTTVPGDLSIDTAPQQGSPRWLIYYYLVQFTCQVALLPGALVGSRVVFRSLSFGVSALILALTNRYSATRKQPATFYVLIVCLILIVEAFHPEGAGPIGSLASVAMYGSILAPILWVPRLKLNLAWFRRIALVVWSFQFASASFGALQVYFPGTFQPSVATVLSDDYLSALQITLANGQHILRPSGLTDTPGGAAVAGTYTILLALGLLMNRARFALRCLLVFSIAVGMFVVYLCEVRSLAVMIAISVLATVAVQVYRGRIRRVLAVSVLFGAIGFVAFVAAVSVGGHDVSERIGSLLNGSPRDIYYTNRGIFLEHTLSELLPEYPLGAGLGRWGMLFAYFGSSTTPIYVEIQWTGWLLDGGVPLIICYSLMLVVTLGAVAKLTRSTRVENGSALASWSALIVGYDVGTIALTFNFTVFMSSFGMDFWLLNSALLTAAANQLATRSAHGVLERGVE